MDVVDVQRLEAEVGAAPLDLVAQVARRHAVGALDHVPRLDDARLDVRGREVGAGIARHCPIEGDESTLRGHHDLVAPNDVPADRGAEGGPDRPLAALVTVVHRRVEDVDAELERSSDRILVEDVRRAVLRPEIGAEAQGRGRRAPRQLAKVAGRQAPGKLLRIALRACRRRAAGDHLASGAHRMAWGTTRNEKPPLTM